MKRFDFLVAIILVNIILTNAQSRFPIKSNSIWRINNEYCCSQDSSTHQEGDEHYKYFVKGDTTIGSYTYFKIYKTGILYLDVPFKIENKYMGAIRDEDNKFFFVANTKSSEELLYNFDLKEGDPVGAYQVYNIDTLEDGRKSFLIDAINVHCGSANTIIEGIGWLGGLLEGNACYSHPGIKGTYLICYSEGEQTKFINTLVAEKCDLLPDYVPSYYFKDVTWKIISGNLMIESSIIMKDCHVTVFNILGRTVLSGRMINASSVVFDINDFSSGIYIVKFENKIISYSFKFLKE